MKIEIDVPDGISGNWEVSTFKVKEKELSQMISLMKSGRGVLRNGDSDESFLMWIENILKN